MCSPDEHITARTLIFNVSVCGGLGLLQHVELAEVSVDKSSLLEHLSHVLHDLQVKLTSLRL